MPAGITIADLNAESYAGARLTVEFADYEPKQAGGESNKMVENERLERGKRHESPYAPGEKTYSWIQGARPPRHPADMAI